MNEARLLQVLLAPHVSEKAAIIGDNSNQVVFKVASSATKPEIKQAVESLFEVNVQGVTVCNQKGKKKRAGKNMGRRSDVRKAYVTLKAGQEIDFLGLEK